MKNYYLSSEHKDFDNELLRSSYLGKKREPTTPANYERYWRALDAAAERESAAEVTLTRKIRVGYRALNADSQRASVAEVRAVSVTEVRRFLTAKGYTEVLAAELNAGERIEQLDEAIIRLRDGYERVKERELARREPEEAVRYAKRWLKVKIAQADRERAERQAQAELDTSKGYVSVIQPRERRVIEAAKKNPVGFKSAALCSGLMAGGGLLVDLVVNFALGVPEPMATAVLLGSGSATIQWISRDSAAERQLAARSLVDFERTSLKLWLHTRYGLSVGKDVLGELVEAVHAEGDTHNFNDLTGRHFKFMKLLDSEGWFVFESAPAVTAEALAQGKAALARGQEVLGRAREAISRIEAEGAPVFMGEGALLHERLSEVLELLERQHLSVEEKHVVARAKQDVAETTATLTALADLGEREAGQQRAADVFGQLIEELSELVAGRKAVLLAELDVQRTYVVERRRPVSGGRLKLEKSLLSKELTSGSHVREAGK